MQNLPFENKSWIKLSEKKKNQVSTIYPLDLIIIHTHTHTHTLMESSSILRGRLSHIWFTKGGSEQEASSRRKWVHSCCKKLRRHWTNFLTFKEDSRWELVIELGFFFFPLTFLYFGTLMSWSEVPKNPDVVQRARIASSFLGYKWSPDSNEHWIENPIKSKKIKNKIKKAVLKRFNSKGRDLLGINRNKYVIFVK